MEYEEEKGESAILNEITQMKNLTCDHIVKYFGYFKGKSYGFEINILIELCEVIKHIKVALETKTLF